MYSFTYKISLGNGSDKTNLKRDKTNLKRDNTNINNKTKAKGYGKGIIRYRIWKCYSCCTS